MFGLIQEGLCAYTPFDDRSVQIQLEECEERLERYMKKIEPILVLM